MTLNDIYLLSQVLAVFALVPSVIYLAVQVRQNTLQARSNAAYQFLEANGNINITVIENKQLASVVRRGLEKHDNLDKDEKLQFMWFVGQHFTVQNTMYALYQNKMLPESQWYPVKKDILTMMSTPGSRTIWDDVAVKALSPAFVTYVEGLLTREEGSYSLGQVLDLKGGK